MGYAVHIAACKDQKGAPRVERVVYAGSDDLDKAKALAEEAFTAKPKGPDTQAYVTDMTDGPTFEQAVYTAGVK